MKDIVFIITVALVITIIPVSLLIGSIYEKKCEAEITKTALEKGYVQKVVMDENKCSHVIWVPREEKNLENTK